MISFSTNARQNLDTYIEKEHNLFGGLKPVRFLSFISLFVLFSLVPTLFTAQIKAVPDKAQAAERSDADPFGAFVANHPVKLSGRLALPILPVSAAEPVDSGNMKLIERVLVPKIFSYKVIQQPEDNPYFVSTEANLVTEFSLPKKYGVIGLMAHNNLAGYHFKKLTQGQEIRIVYKDGHTDRYTVSEIHQFRALEPTNPVGQFLDLETGKLLTATELFERMYTGAPRVTFQTCIYASGDSSWGRLFVIATPGSVP